MKPLTREPAVGNTKLFASSLVPPPSATAMVAPKFHVITGQVERITFSAGDLRLSPELRRLQSEIARHAVSNATLFVAGLHVDSPFRTAQTSKLRRDLEDLGVIFVERPTDIDTPEKLAAWIEAEYGPVPAAITNALEPLPPISVAKGGHDIQPYLDPPPADANGADHFFLATKKSNE